MNVLVLVAGIAGLAVAVYGLCSLTVDAVRHRQYVDVGVALVVVVVAVCLLIAYGDRVIR